LSLGNYFVQKDFYSFWVRYGGNDAVGLLGRCYFSRYEEDERKWRQYTSTNSTGEVALIRIQQCSYSWTSFTIWI
jgi:hypothetical protein